MTFLRRFLVVLSATSLVAFAGDASANILLNPGFESGSGADAADWNENFGPAGATARSSGMPSSGSFAAHMSFDHNANPPAAGSYSVSQNLGANVVDNADNFDLSFDAKLDSSDTTGMNAFYQLLWLDQDGSHGGGVKGETLTSLFDLGISTSYQTFSVPNIDAPDGADSFELRFQIAAGPIPAIANGLWVDNASLAVVGGALSGDFDGDGDVDGRDFLAWQRGESPDPFSAGDLEDWQAAYGTPALGAAEGVTAVPEPSSLLLLLSWLAAGGMGRRSLLRAHSRLITPRHDMRRN